MKKIVFSFLLAISLLIAAPIRAQARYVSYPGSWTVLQNFNDDSFSLLTHYTLTPKLSVGYRYEYFRDHNWHFNAIQANALLKRWNMPDAQANLWLLSGIGSASARSGSFSNPSQTAAFTGISADWENRRYFISYSNRYLTAGDTDEFFNQKARLGFAPYIGEFNDLHTWIMLEADHHNKRKDNVTWTPLVRFFKGSLMAEAGWTIGGGPLINLRILF